VAFPLESFFQVNNAEAKPLILFEEILSKLSAFFKDLQKFVCTIDGVSFIITIAHSQTPQDLVNRLNPQIIAILSKNIQL
jgi:hypothetical protein